jgi:hypothetical protein
MTKSTLNKEMNMRYRFWLPAVLGLLSALYLTQVAAADLLPQSLSGRWVGTIRAKGGSAWMPVDFAWSLQIAKQNPDGSFEGTITYEGRQCSAKNAPMKGNFDGAELVVKTELEPKAQCGPTTLRMKKAGGKHMFESTMRRQGGVDGYLDPS